MEYRGEMAGLATAVCWSLTSIFFTLGSRRWGALSLNRMRLVLAVVFLSAAHAVSYGSPLPDAAGSREWLLLGISGIVGLVIGDSFLFHSFTLIGPRKAMLVMSTVPILSGILAWITLGESLTGIQILGVLVTVSAVIAVVAERARGGPIGEERLVAGLLLALGGAVAQAVALVAAKEGMGTGVTGLSGTWIRMVVAMGAMWGIAALTGDAAKTLRAARDRRGLGYALGGSFFGPFLGVWMSLVAVLHAPVGVASSLMGLVPIFVLPLVRGVFGERISLRAVLGTVAATGGVVLLFLR
jgi:drug/metabolite transporter (DMT)-like permease